MITHPQAQAVLDFWFDEQTQPFWFAKSDEFDKTLTDKFADTLIQASLGELEEWRNTIQGRLAEIIVLDQFSRNIYRDTPKAFAQDGMALVLAQVAIGLPQFADLSEIQRHFLLMPYMHSESAVIHKQAVKLFGRYVNDNALDFERKHKVIIDRFGRYPHRNAILGRVSSDDELAFLQEPNSAF
ncbi:DUF924 family protein [Ursidibacter sp. B-7004-1]